MMISSIAAISLAFWAIHISKAFTPSSNFGCQSRSAAKCNMSRFFSLCFANEDQLGVVDHRRRGILAKSILLLPTAFPSLSNAAELDKSSEMNKLTRQIRTSIVRGAQIIDKLDGKWERFSDEFGLGENRNQPKKKVLGVGGKAEVEGKEIQAALDENFCLDVLNTCDMVSASFSLNDFLLLFSFHITSLTQVLQIK